jgi:hypothetical protein
MSCLSKPMAVAIGVLLLASGAGVHAAVWESTISRDAWVTHASERRLLDLDPIREILARFEESEQVRITIHYPGGDAGSRWAVQFRDRLVAYGVPSTFMEMVPGSGGLDILRVSLTDGR